MSIGYTSLGISEVVITYSMNRPWSLLLPQVSHVSKALEPSPPTLDPDSASSYAFLVYQRESIIGFFCDRHHPIYFVTDFSLVLSPQEATSS